MAKASPSCRVVLRVTTPITRPLGSKTGPPELPGLIAIPSWRKEWLLIIVIELTIPRLIAFSRIIRPPTPGLPMTVTSSPLRKR